MPRRTYRSWPLTVLGASTASAVLALSAWALLSGANSTVYGILTGAGAIGLWYAVRLSVAVDESGLRIHQITGTRLVSRDEVDDIDCDVVAMHGMFGFYAPILTVGDTAIVLRTLGSYRREIAEQRARDLRVAAARTRVATG